MTQISTFTTESRFHEIGVAVVRLESGEKDPEVRSFTE
jgi:hypothetical protein